MRNNGIHIFQRSARIAVKSLNSDSQISYQRMVQIIRKNGVADKISCLLEGEIVRYLPLNWAIYQRGIGNIVGEIGRLEQGQAEAHEKLPLRNDDVHVRQQRILQFVANSSNKQILSTRMAELHGNTNPGASESGVSRVVSHAEVVSG